MRFSVLRNHALFGLLFLSGSAQGQGLPTARTVEAYLYSTMPSMASNRPEMAMDGDPKTTFKSMYGMDDGDDFLVILTRPISVSAIRVVTGDQDGNDQLTSAFVEVSGDGVSFKKVAEFDKNGKADAMLRGREVMAVRIKVDHRTSAPKLVIQEISIQSPTAIAHVQYGAPRAFADLSQAPDLQVWAATAEKSMESFWLDAEAMLHSDNFIPPNTVNIVYRTGPGVTGVAATGGGVMEVNSKWCREHPDDTGLTVHEITHVIQAMRGSVPGWLIEGTADYVRWVKFEPQHFHPRINVARATYHDAYRTSATFLAWVALHYDSAIVTKLNDDARFGRYNNSLFVKYCGKDVDRLWSEFIAAYKADPDHIITPPVPEAMRPRELPKVGPGAALPIDLSGIFDTSGIEEDGKTFGSDGGFDGGGAAFSNGLLMGSLNSTPVRFRLGPAGGNDAITCHGNAIPLPAEAHRSLWLLASAFDGGQTNQTITVTYVDGTTATFAQNFSDWFVPQDFPGELRVRRMPYRNMADGSRDPRTFYAYLYGFPLDTSKTLKSITLPNDQNIRVLAITLED